MAKNKEVMKKSALIGRTIPYIKKEKWLFFLTLILCICAAVLNASTSFILKAILDKYLPNENFKMVKFAILGYGGIIILVFGFRYLFSFVNTITGMRIEKRIREDAILKINHLPVDYFSLEPDGKIVAKITSDSAGVRIFYTKMFDIFSAIINIIVVYIAIILLKPILGLVTLVIVPILLIWVTVYRKWVHKYFVDQRETGSRITGKLNENIVGTPIIQDFNNEDIILDEYRQLLSHYVKCDRRTARLNNTFGFELLSLLKSLLKIGLLVFLAYQVINKKDFASALSAGLIGALVDNIDKMITPFSTIFDNLNELEDSMVGATRCYMFIDEKNDSKIFDGKKDIKEIEGNVEFSHVNFGYVENTYVLKDFSLKIDKGQTVGIVGATGAGKSSLMNLLLRYNDYEEGSIKLDDMEIKEYNKQEYRKQLGIVLQTPAIFSGTIKSNVTMEREVSDDEVINALNQVG
ncbi:MAG: ABC transporter ATP-binding protein/permease, partial [Acholeplasmatales bacterium]|nr:ABC transporter ATP-binding protein/permease [Acholeplasmatales bacterium]